MTVIAWDGKTLATDRMANDGSQKWESSKAWYGMSEDKEVVIITGVGLAHYIRQLSEWYQQGMPEPSRRSYLSATAGGCTKEALRKVS